MTTPRDDTAGLSERLRERIKLLGPTPDSMLNFMNGICPLLEEAATALDALQARVKALEAEIPQLLTEQRRKLCAEHDKDITELNRVRRVSKEAIEAAESRATRAEQERDEATRDADRYRFLRSRDLDTIHKGGVFAGMTPQNIILNEDDLDREVDAAIRRLAAGTGDF